MLYLTLDLVYMLLEFSRFLSKVVEEVKWVPKEWDIIQLPFYSKGQRVAGVTNVQKML